MVRVGHDATMPTAARRSHGRLRHGRREAPCRRLARRVALRRRIGRDPVVLDVCGRTRMRALLTMGEWRAVIDRAETGQITEPIWNVDRDDPAVRRDLRRRRCRRAGSAPRTCGPGRAPADRGPVAVPRRFLPAPGVRAAPPVLRGRRASSTWPVDLRRAVVPGLRREARRSSSSSSCSARAQRRPRVHELAEQGAARDGVRPQRRGHDRSTSTRGGRRPSGSTPTTWSSAPARARSSPRSPGIDRPGVYDFATWSRTSTTSPPLRDHRRLARSPSSTARSSRPPAARPRSCPAAR